MKSQYSPQAPIGNLRICQLSNRASMGLPDSYHVTSGDDLMSEFEEMRSLSLLQMKCIAENGRETFKKRFAAGQMLGLLGDPRISLYQPHMISIEQSTFSMGTRTDELDSLVNDSKELLVEREWLEKEAPAHQVEINAMQIGKYLITNFEYREFLKENPHQEIPTFWEFGIFPAMKSNHPVYGITLESAKNYAQWLGKSTGRLFRLPTEAEWEYSSTGPNRLEFPWGNKFIEEFANSAEMGLGQTTPVGIFPQGASWCGCLDLAGNVEEFTSTLYAPYIGGKVIKDDLLEVLGNYPVTRGGSFARFRDLMRSRRRHGPFPQPTYPTGFRLAESREA